MNTFTPGPWTLDGPIICGHGTESDVEGYSIAKMLTTPGRFNSCIPDGVKEANARLIAAAPDLYEACKIQHAALEAAMAMIIVLTRNLYPNEPDKHFMPSQSSMFAAIKQGNAAIAKAEDQ